MLTWRSYDAHRIASADVADTVSWLRRRTSSGDGRGLQNRCGRAARPGGFDSRPPPPPTPGRLVVLDHRRATPRTDTVLADPALVAAAGRLGPQLVKDAARRAIEECRQGRVRPQEVVAATLAALPATATTLRP